MNDKDMGERLRQYRQSLDLTIVAIAKGLGVDRTTFTKYENGQSRITDRTVRLLSKMYGLNPEWLKTGKGKMNLAESLTAEMIMVPVHHLHKKADLKSFMSKTTKRALPVDFIKVDFGTDPANIILVAIEDYNLFPEYVSGDILALNTKSGAITDGIYICEIENQLYIKDLSINENMILLTSGRSKKIWMKTVDFKAIGKVIWSCKFQE